MILHGAATSSLLLRSIDPSEVTGDYVSWLNDYQITRFLEVRYSQVTLATQKNFVEEANQSEHSCLFGIFTPDDKLIGTTKVGPIDKNHKTAAIGLMIGSRAHHGLGYGSTTIRILCDIFMENGLIRKMNAGVMSANIASIRAFEKNSFTREGQRVSQLLGPEGDYMDEILFGKLLNGKFS
jgi:ribosomal-protein-alanine N-acetyltransferase